MKSLPAWLISNSIFINFKKSIRFHFQKRFGRAFQNTMGLFCPVQVKIFVSVYKDRDSDRDREKTHREKNYIDRDAK